MWLLVTCVCQSVFSTSRFFVGYRPWQNENSPAVGLLQKHSVSQYMWKTNPALAGSRAGSCEDPDITLSITVWDRKCVRLPALGRLAVRALADIIVSKPGCRCIKSKSSGAGGRG